MVAITVPRSLREQEQMLGSLRSLGSQKSPVNCWGRCSSSDSGFWEARQSWYHAFLRPPDSGCSAMALALMLLLVIVGPFASREPVLESEAVSVPEYSSIYQITPMLRVFNRSLILMSLM